MSRPDAVSAKAAVRRRKRRSFTRSEANHSLVLVRRILEDAVASYRLLIRLQRRMQGIARSGKPADVEPLQDEYHSAASRLNAYIQELRKVGCELKDLELGVVDFPAVYKGEEIRLCWQLGEPKLAHFHTKAAGFAERNPLPDDFE